MAESSRSRVTITLGRSGQVVKREGQVLDSGFSNSRPTAGTKRSVRDRLGTDVNGTTFSNKRERGEANISCTSDANGVDELCLHKDDLRFKINRKNVFSRVQSDGQQNGVDLREKLSRTARGSPVNVDKRQHTPEPNYARQRMPEPNHSRQHMPEPNYSSQCMPGPNYSSQRTSEPNYSSQRMSEPNYPSQRMPEPNYARQYMPLRKDVSILGQIPSTRIADPLPQMDTLRDPYSPWTLDSLRRRSPEGDSGTSRNLSPQRNEELRKRPLIRRYDDVRKVPYSSKDIVESSRTFNTATYMSKPTAPAGNQPAPPSHVLQQSLYKVDEPLSVDSLLRSLGLEKYAICFKAEEVDMSSLRQMGDHDLKELGIPMGPRKKILLALLSRSKRRL